jgi:hypothetical protein
MNTRLGSIILIMLALALPAIADDKSVLNKAKPDSVLSKPRQIAKEGEILSDSKGRVYHIVENPQAGVVVVKIFDPLSRDEGKGSKPVRASDSVDISGPTPHCPLVPIYCEAPQYRPDGTTYWLKFICGWKQGGSCN